MYSVSNQERTEITEVDKYLLPPDQDERCGICGTRQWCGPVILSLAMYSSYSTSQSTAYKRRSAMSLHDLTHVIESSSTPLSARLAPSTQIGSLLSLSSLACTEWFPLCLAQNIPHHTFPADSTASPSHNPTKSLSHLVFPRSYTSTYSQPIDHSVARTANVYHIVCLATPSFPVTPPHP